MHRIVFFVFVFVWKQATMDAQEQQKELIRRNAELAKVLSLSLCYTLYTFTCKLGCRFYSHKAMAL
jgi:hypothetical protein